jgi:hypothetical protein
VLIKINPSSSWIGQCITSHNYLLFVEFEFWRWKVDLNFGRLIWILVPVRCIG